MKASELELIRTLFGAPDADVNVLERERKNLMSYVKGSLRLDYVSKAKPFDMPQLIPHLVYDDIEAAIEWLERAFGFQELKEHRHNCNDGRVGHAALRFGTQPHDPMVMLGMPSAHGVSPRQAASVALYIYVTDIEVHYNRARAAGARITMELSAQPWGDRFYQATDPEGHQWQFAERVV